MTKFNKPDSGGGKRRASRARSAPTVYDVAADAGVSIATVSRVLRRPDDVSRSTAARVAQSIRDLGYVPSGSARGLANRRAGAIGICFPGFDDAGEIDPTLLSGAGASVRFDVPNGVDPTTQRYMSEVTRGVEVEAWRHKMTVTLAVARGEHAGEVLDGVAGRVDALVTLAGTFPDEKIAHVARRIPVAVVAGRRATAEHDHISVANAEGMRALTAHLIDVHGITDIAFVGGVEEAQDGEERFSGFREALTDAGLAVPDAPLRRGDFTQLQGRVLGRALIAADEIPRAVVCVNDQTALGVLDTLKEAGVRVPEDVIVTGFDGIDATRHCYPRLTTVQQPMLDLGRVAVDCLVARIDDTSRLAQTLVLPVEVLLRESCGCTPEAPAPDV